MTFEEKLYIMAYKEGYYVTFQEIQAIANKPSLKKAYEEAYTKGYNEGYNDGYNEGYDKSMREFSAEKIAGKMKNAGVEFSLIAEYTRLSIEEIGRL